MTNVAVRTLGPQDAGRLAPLVAAYAQAMRRGAPRRPDQYFAERLTEDRTAEVIGAFVEEELVGFLVFFDLPDTISGLRIGQIDDIYVLPAHRRKGVGHQFIERLKEEAQQRGWSHLRWIVPKPVDAAATGEPDPGLPGEIAKPSTSRLFEIPVDGH